VLKVTVVFIGLCHGSPFLFVSLLRKIGVVDLLEMSVLRFGSSAEHHSINAGY